MRGTHVLDRVPNSKGTKQLLRTDLPNPARIERAKLAAKGHTLKANGTVVDTRLREKAISVWLEVKKQLTATGKLGNKHNFFCVECLCRMRYLHYPTLKNTRSIMKLQTNM